MINKKIPIFLLILFIGLTLVSAGGLRITSVDSVNVIKNGNPVVDEFIIDTVIDGSGQDFIGTFSPNEIRQAIGDEMAPYPKDSFTISIGAVEETAIYEIDRDTGLDIYEYKYIPYDCQKRLGICYGDAKSCPSNTVWQTYKESAWGHDDDRQCVTKNLIGMGGLFETPTIKFNAMISIDSPSASSKKVQISSDQSSVSLGSVGSASWYGSLITGDSPPNQDNYRAIKLKSSNRWNIAGITTATNYATAVGDFERDIDGDLTNIILGKETSYAVNSKIINLNNEGRSLLSERKSIGGDFSQNSEGEIFIKLTGQINVPKIQFNIKASWIGIIIPSGIPRIINYNSDAFSSGESGELTLEIQNIGDYKGVFAVRVVSCDPFISTGTAISDRLELSPGSKGSVNIPLSTGDVSEDLIKSCSVEVYDVNDPTQTDTEVIQLRMTPAKICNPNEVIAQGNIIKKCSEDGMEWNTLKTCEYGVEKKSSGWDCKSKSIFSKKIAPETIASKDLNNKIKGFCSSDSDCDTMTYCHSGISRCIQRSGCIELINNGDSADKIDVVFVGDEYYYADELKKDALEIVDYYDLDNLEGLMSVEPFKSNREKFNFWMVLGEDKIAVRDGGKPSIQDSEKVAAQCPQGDHTITLSKKSFRSYAWFGGGAHLSFGSYKSPVGRGRLFLHEFGHAFGYLMDEYTEPGKSDSPGSPNCAPDMETAIDWWGSLNGIEYAQGCSYTEDNIRPFKNSIMRTHWILKDDYKIVNEQALLKRLEVFK